ncbi:MurT ligase domain-containing protein [Methanosphaera sp. ISO3-F5]|uniref:MurT ligase domain-containing protein n=1 Tax=Methanosphaera sp. ISO3-F5 TaxID=1452353 RepID=UPI002B261A18|nr:MurT ligase domain-containing protein [Methanosphaera sp. ISO3-F5]WQH64120.1 MurT ligase domain-containing protein [Methanosphaera sp. ISO3-F5]
MLNKILNYFALIIGKSSIFFLNIFNKSGTAFPGRVALLVNKSFLKVINDKCDKIILVTGTNGKTTTNNLINKILENYTVLSNLKGANMIQGVATTYVRNTRDYYDYGIFEVDEGSLDRITSFLKPDYILITNFFRDQLDRYGEIEGIISEVFESIKLLPDVKLILNADDPYVYQFSKMINNKVITFGMDITSNKILETNLTINKCPLCGEEIEYTKNTYGHLGNYHCTHCNFSNNDKDYTVIDVNESDISQKITINHDNQQCTVNFPYIGLYNSYNVCGVFALMNQLGIETNHTLKSIEEFSFELGRMEEFEYKNKKIKIILTKNPIGLSQATRIISNDNREKTIVHILNDNMADGRDISWIWDANTYCINDETITNYYCSGIRAEEIALKKKYDDVALEKIHIFQKWTECVDTAIEDDVEIVYVLPTYTAIFETRDYIDDKVKRSK